MNYDFRQELLTIHEANLRNPKRLPGENEFFLGDGARIAIAPDSHEVVCVAAADFCDFLD